jgi:5-methylcytosine-specific restriction endonuclease McrA
MRRLKNKDCSECGAEYTPTGSCSKYCPTCRPVVTDRIRNEGINLWQYAKGILNGTGSGSATGKGAENHMYTHGRSTFARWARERKETVGLCEDCGKDIKDATHYMWVGHHKDHDRSNNTMENLVILCKRCHQIEHECWKSFESVETIRKE